MSSLDLKKYNTKYYADGDILTAEDVNNIQYGLTSLMSGNSTKIKTLYLGRVVDKGYTETALENKNNRVSMLDAFVLPTDWNTTYTFHSTDSHIMMGIRHGTEMDTLGTHLYWIAPEETFTIPSTAKCYRCCWAYCLDGQSTPGATDTSTVFNASILTEMIENGQLFITYEAKDTSNVIDRNFDSEAYIKPLMMDRTQNLGSKLRNDLYTYPIICHTSDIHGDYERMKNFFEYSNYLNASMNFITGDLVGYKYFNGANFIVDLDNKYGKGNTFIAPGNHDCYYLLPDEIYETYIAPYKDKNGYVCENTAYYYKDIDTYSLRIISINCYEYSKSYQFGSKATISQTQVDWICQTLLSTPVGYGVCILLHPPMSSYANVTKQNHYWQTHKDETSLEACGVWKTWYIEPETLLIDIVDAFISHTTITDATYTNYDGTTVTVNADFSAVDDTTEFIAYFNGHTHCDVVGYYTKAKNPQVVCTVCCGIGMYAAPSYAKWANVCDIPRGVTGKTQDAFNVYIIDRANHVIRVGRVGSNVIVSNKKRDIMTIDYKNIVIAEE